MDFSKGNMFLFQFLDDKKAWSFGEAPLPFTAFQYGSLIITDDELLKELASVPRCNMTIEAVSYTHLDVYKRQSGNSGKYQANDNGDCRNWELEKTLQDKQRIMETVIIG